MKNDDARKKKILIVEDDVKSIKLTKDLLEMAGYEVIYTINGEEGIKVAIEHNPDLMILDFQMPGLDGLQVYEKLKKNEKTKEIKVVFFTASVIGLANQKIVDSGCPVILKPVNTRTFAKEVGEILK